MWTRGTKSRPPEELAEEIDSLGASLYGFSGRNSFGVEAKGLAKDFPKLLGIVADIIAHPTFPKEELYKVKEEQRAEIRRQRDYLVARCFRLFRKTLYRRHPYRLSILGTEETLERIGRKDLIRYWKRYAVPSNMVLSIVGDLPWEEVEREVKRAFGELPAGKVPIIHPPGEERPREVREREFTYQKGKQVHLVLGFLGTTLDEDDRYPLEVLEAAMSGQGGRFFTRLRDEMGLAYAVTFFVRADLDPGYLGVYMATSPSKLPQALQGIKALLKEVRERGITEEELKRAKGYLIGGHEVGLQGSLSLASALSFGELYGLGWDTYLKYPERIERVTREDVLRVARKYIDLNAYTLVILKPSRE